MKRIRLASATENNNKRECIISQQELASFTFKTMEKKKPFFSPKRIIALYLKTEKEKKKDMQHRGTELQEKNNPTKIEVE